MAMEDCVFVEWMLTVLLFSQTAWGHSCLCLLSLEALSLIAFFFICFAGQSADTPRGTGWAGKCSLVVGPALVAAGREGLVDGGGPGLLCSLCLQYKAGFVPVYFCQTLTAAIFFWS